MAKPWGSGTYVWCDATGGAYVSDFLTDREVLTNFKEYEGVVGDWTYAVDDDTYETNVVVTCISTDTAVTPYFKVGYMYPGAIATMLEANTIAGSPLTLSEPSRLARCQWVGDYLENYVVITGSSASYDGSRCIRYQDIRKIQARVIFSSSCPDIENTKGYKGSNSVRNSSGAQRANLWVESTLGIIGGTSSGYASTFVPLMSKYSNNFTINSNVTSAITNGVNYNYHAYDKKILDTGDWYFANRYRILSGSSYSSATFKYSPYKNGSGNDSLYLLQSESTSSTVKASLSMSGSFRVDGTGSTGGLYMVYTGAKLSAMTSYVGDNNGFHPHHKPYIPMYFSS